MKKIIKGFFALILAAALAAGCFAEESVSGAAELIKTAKAYIEEGNKEKAVEALDAAFEAANSEGDEEALMKIGDLYIAADPSLKEKAIEAWTAAGHWKCQ